MWSLASSRFSQRSKITFPALPKIFGGVQLALHSLIGIAFQIPTGAPYHVDLDSRLILSNLNSFPTAHPSGYA